MREESGSFILYIYMKYLHHILIIFSPLGKLTLLSRFTLGQYTHLHCWDDQYIPVLLLKLNLVIEIKIT